MKPDEPTSAAPQPPVDWVSRAGQLFKVAWLVLFALYLLGMVVNVGLDLFGSPRRGATSTKLFP